jgi:F-type H+-transporting ATPase subunit c
MWIVIMSGLTVALGAFAGSFGMARAIASSVESIARQPESTSEIRTTMIIGLALIESLTIYCLVISLILLFVYNGG